MRILTSLAALATLGMLAGCGGQLSVANQYSNDLEAANALGDQLDNTGGTPAATMPAAGSASYTGWLAITPATAPESHFLGEATVTADFDSRTMAGAASGFLGVDENNHYDEYDGNIALANGDIGVLAKSDFNIDANGTLTGNGNTVIVDATLYGSFLGPDGESINALATGSAAGITYNGTVVNGDMRLGAEQ